MMHRPRRLRKTPAIRKMVQEVTLSVSDFIYPLFIVEGVGIKKEISSLPGVFHFSVDRLPQEIAELTQLGILHVLLFGVIADDKKDPLGTVGFQPDNVIVKAIKAIKQTNPHMTVITDVCLCEYTDHGHCGKLTENFDVDNDDTLKLLAKMALIHAEAGADILAPSDMMDGRISYLRQTLDEAGLIDKAIMSYSVKYASSYYGPFRIAAGSAPGFGDRKTYQMDYNNKREALKEVALDVLEGADFIMVKPALAYLDIIKEVKQNTYLPVVAYNVSGEYAMLKMAVATGMMNESVIEETLTSIKRAGADVIITYFAKEIAQKQKEQHLCTILSTSI